MAMLYLVDIEAACRVEALLEATREVSSCKVVYGLKVVGENRLVLVVDGDVDKLTAAMGSCMSGEKVSCSPLRTYDGFARNVLGVSETIAKPDTPRITGEHLYWLHFQVEYKGKNK
ncbi:hypothetical protein LSAT2_004416 [Lamellibrachia satsuma]|nr:hypothetical protein LSAT2_004416 [Lamellibrachia satsuma]